MGSNYAMKLVILGLTVVGFAMTLTIGSLVWLMLDVVTALTNSPGRGAGAGFVALLAIVAALGGLAVAYVGAMSRE